MQGEIKEPENLEIIEEPAREASAEFSHAEKIMMERFGKTPDQILQERKDRAESQKRNKLELIKKTGLDWDAYNNWITLFYFLDSNQQDRLNAPLFYEDYIRRVNSKEVADFVIEKSDPQKVLEHDNLVREFLEKIENILSTNNLALVKEFHDKADRLIRGKE